MIARFGTGQIHSNLKILAIFSFAASLLIGCQTTSGKVEESDKSKGGKKERLLQTAEFVPSFTITPKQPLHELNIFVSPTCNRCELLLLDILDALDDEDDDMEGVKITFSLMPRSEFDFKLISGFICVPAKKRAKAIVAYYQKVNELIGRQAIDQSTSQKAYVTTLHKFGVPENKRAKCETNKRNREIVAAVYHVGNKARAKNLVPIVVYKGTTLDLYKYEELKNSMRWLNG